MRQYHYITFKTRDNIAYINLNRPKKYNALHPPLLEELGDLCDTLAQLTDIRVVLLSGHGDHFCAGADLKWMQEQGNKPFNENKADAQKLGGFFQKLSTLPQPLIGVAHGNVYGGGLGLLACCDTVIASENSYYSFSEVKLGLTPATITPYVIRKIGYSHCRALFISAERFNALKAQEIGLIHHVVAAQELKQSALAFAQSLKENAPQAVAQTKQLVDSFYPIEEGMLNYTAELLAHMRAGDEASNRINLFLNNKK